MASTLCWVFWCTLIIEGDCTCGWSFFLPPLRGGKLSYDLNRVEVAACDQMTSGTIPFFINMSTIFDDVISIVSALSNQTVRVDLAFLLQKEEDLNKYGVRIFTSMKASVNAFVNNSSDVINVFPIEALGTNYFIPNLCASEFENQLVVFYSVSGPTNVSFEMHHSSPSHCFVHDRTLIKPGDTTKGSSYHTRYIINITRRSEIISNGFRAERLIVERATTLRIKASMPIGIVVLLASSRYLHLLNSLNRRIKKPEDENRSSHLKQDAEAIKCRLPARSTNDAENVLMAADSVGPLSSMGQSFYLPIDASFLYVNLVISGPNNSQVRLEWNCCGLKNLTESFFLRAASSLRLRRPKMCRSTHGHVEISANSSIFVYIIIDICHPVNDENSFKQDGGATICCRRNSFFVPSVKQFTKCCKTKYCPCNKDFTNDFKYVFSSKLCLRHFSDYFPNDVDDIQNHAALMKFFSLKPFQNITHFSPTPLKLSSSFVWSTSSYLSLPSAKMPSKLPSQMSTLSPIASSTSPQISLPKSRPLVDICCQCNIRTHCIKMSYISTSTTTTAINSTNCVYTISIYRSPFNNVTYYTVVHNASSYVYFSLNIKDLTLTSVNYWPRNIVNYNWSIPHGWTLSDVIKYNQEADENQRDNAQHGKQKKIDNLKTEKDPFQWTRENYNNSKRTRVMLQAAAPAINAISQHSFPGSWNAAKILWDLDYRNTQSGMPLLPVVTSLAVAIFAVMAVVAVFFFMEVLSKRRRICGVRIRPFVY